ncbi:CRISPR-associated endoribonuclease Cas6 [Nonomuraea sp. NEAU-A123]|uniref:CRISPR-associated endoribonuclease Cas6 n=1 Tax=Nonomuraea sp. NEAU-A123 TaxID=2839649 RepID=UPI001BE46BB3|nr:CRISPR-associated endoribonuclease Cas6 [Nonomuraea sp. NEAU-A123]MBT2234406.1 CRISPR-associated endoribonuclease Cas6 [Nonomuraea sp. NEAU-A123]
MRFRVDVAASKPVLPWHEVHGPARAVIYDLIESQDAAVAEELHDVGWQGGSLRPVGVSPPLFSGTRRLPGAYSASSDGVISMGSPVPRIAACLLAAMAGRGEIRWGSVTLSVKGVQLDGVTDHADGFAVFETVSPVLVKHEDLYLVPGDAHFQERLTHNLRHKADVLGLPNEVEVEVEDSGPRRRFDMPKGFRIGATARVRVAGAPQLLDALYEWGLGLSTVEGFGWIR